MADLSTNYMGIPLKNPIIVASSGLTDSVDKIVELENTELFDNNKGESETIAGFVLEIYGRFPRKNEIIKFENFSFKIEAMDKKRIKKVKVTIHRN